MCRSIRIQKGEMWLLIILLLHAAMTVGFFVAATQAIKSNK